MTKLYNIKILSVYIWLVAIAHAGAQNYANYAKRAQDPRLRQFSDNHPARHTNSQSNNAPREHNKRHDLKPGNYHRPRFYATPVEVAKYRNEGNFYQAQPLVAPPTKQQALYNVHQGHIVTTAGPPAAVFDHRVVHVEPLPRLYDEYRRRRYTATPIATGLAGESEVRQDNKNVKVPQKFNKPPQQAALGQTTRAYHDIYMRYASPQKLSVGHVESRPGLLEKRFESLNAGNRYKGEVIWADATGGYGAHHWDLAQGKLH